MLISSTFYVHIFVRTSFRQLFLSNYITREKLPKQHSYKNLYVKCWWNWLQDSDKTRCDICTRKKKEEYLTFLINDALTSLIPAILTKKLSNFFCVFIQKFFPLILDNGNVILEHLLTSNLLIISYC